jgi:hypothetical protein
MPQEENADAVALARGELAAFRSWVDRRMR